jgi:hypothetical protein
MDDMPNVGAVPLSAVLAAAVRDQVCLDPLDLDAELDAEWQLGERPVAVDADRGRGQPWALRPPQPRRDCDMCLDWRTNSWPLPVNQLVSMTASSLKQEAITSHQPRSRLCLSEAPAA